MKFYIRKISSAFIYNACIVLFVAVLLSACKKDDIGSKQKELLFETEEYSAPTEDALNVVSNLPAYVFAYDYKDFGAALVNRMQNRVAEINEETAENLVSVVLHSSQIESLVNNGQIEEWQLILAQLLLGRNIIIVEPTIKDFKNFCNTITSIYILLSEIEEGQELLDEIDVIPGARQTLEAFYDMSMNPEKIESMFILDTDSNGVFAEAIAVRGCDFHIVDRMTGVAVEETTHEQVIDEEGNTEPVEDPEIESNANANVITPYSYGLFADMFTKWINEQEYYVDMEEQMRNRALNSLITTRATDTNKYNLEDICSVQKVQYTISASTPSDIGPKLPVTVSFEICSIYMEDDNSDYYCVNKNILSYNQVLDCGPSGEQNKRKWRKNENFGKMRWDFWNGGSEYYVFPYYGPFMRNIEGRSICHTHTDDFIDSTNAVVDLRSANSIKGADGVTVEKYSPKNSIGSVDKTDGFSIGFDGGICLPKDIGVDLGVSLSWDTSTTQSIDDLEIIVSTTKGSPEWKYIGQNLPDAFYNLILDPSHTEAPSIMCRECEVDQSWIWKVPNPSGSYRLYDETKVVTTAMYYENENFQSHSRFVNETTTKRVSFLMMPPPRSQQVWMMNVAPYSDELNSMLATTHNRFWKKDNHEFKLNDSSDDSRISIEQFINDFERDLNSKIKTWKSRNFKGTFTFSYYNVNDENDDHITFDFVVE